MQSQLETQPVDAIEVDAREPYVPPAIVEIGQVGSITFGVTGPGADVGVFFP